MAALRERTYSIRRADAYSVVKEITTMTDGNVKQIQTIYEAFGRGDVAAIQALCDERTRWDFDVGASDVPWHAPVLGRAGVPAFLGAFVENVALEKFEPTLFVHSDDHVIAHVRIAYTVKRSGKRVDMDQLHWWTLAGGKVTRLRHFEDTAAVVAAWRA